MTVDHTKEYKRDHKSNGLVCHDKETLEAFLSKRRKEISILNQNNIIDSLSKRINILEEKLDMILRLMQK